MKVSYGDKKYNDQLSQLYREMRMTDVQLKKIRNPRLFDMSDKEQADTAANILSRALKQKAKLERGIVR